MRSILLVRSKLWTEEAVRLEETLQQACLTGLDGWIGKRKADTCFNEVLHTNEILRIDNLPNPIKNVTHFFG